MSGLSKEAARQRAQMLVELRRQHSEPARQAQELLKAQQGVRRILQQALKDGPCTVPQLAQKTGLPAHEALWHLTAMKKYGVVEEAGMDDDGEYYLYGLSKEEHA